MPLVSYPQIDRENTLPVYVTGVGIGYAQPPVARPTLTFPQILVSASGCGVVTVGNEKYELPEGYGFYLRRGVDYHYGPKQAFAGEGIAADEWVVDWVTFEITSSSLEAALFTSENFVMFRFSNPDGITSGIRAILDAFSKDAQYGGFYASAAMYQLLIAANRETLDLPAKQDRRCPAVSAVMDYVDSNYADNITLELLCGVAGGLSEQYFCRLFKQYTGMRPIEYILKKRIGIARSYLEKTDMPIPEVAERSGFNNTSYFYRNFKKFTGISPLTCRQNALNLNGTKTRSRSVM